MHRLALLVAGALAAPAPAQTFGPPYMPGVWSLGETRNCETGPAWVFLADGYYVEVQLPDRDHRLPACGRMRARPSPTRTATCPTKT